MIGRGPSRRQVVIWPTRDGYITICSPAAFPNGRGRRRPLSGKTMQGGSEDRKRWISMVDSETLEKKGGPRRARPGYLRRRRFHLWRLVKQLRKGKARPSPSGLIYHQRWTVLISMTVSLKMELLETPWQTRQVSGFSPEANWAVVNLP